MSIVLSVPNFVKKFYALNYSKTSGISATAWYEAFSLTNIEAIALILSQVNTTPQANNMDLRLTVDDEIIQMLNTATNNNAYEYLYIETAGLAPAMGDNPYLQKTATVSPFGFIEKTALGDIGFIPLKGKNVLFEYSFDTIGTAQEFYVDFWYYKKEAA